MANKNHPNLPVSVGVFLRLMTSPNLPRGQELTAMISLLGLLALLRGDTGVETGQPDVMQLMPPKKTWLHQGEMCRNVIFRGASLA